MADLYFTSGTEQEPWEWAVYEEIYNPSIPLDEQKFQHRTADLSSDIGPVYIGHQKGQ